MSPSIRATAIAVLFAIAASCVTPPADRRPAALASAASTTYLHAGFGAGPAVFTGGDGAVLEERRYEPFSVPIETPDLVARDLDALGKRRDPATGWSDGVSRWMVPATARWLSGDPPVMGPAPGAMLAPWRLHPYQYVDQNPVVYWDPDGRSPNAIAMRDVAAWLTRWMPAAPPSAAGAAAVGVAPVAAGAGLAVALGAIAAHTPDNLRMCGGDAQCMHFQTSIEGARGRPIASAVESVVNAASRDMADRLSMIRARAEAERKRTPEKTVTLYRGVPSTSVAYLDALHLIADPIGGPSTPFEHNAGSTDSDYTSWTRNPSVAQWYGTDGESTHGVVLVVTVPVSRTTRSPDERAEQEVLLRGRVHADRAKHVGYSRNQSERLEDD